MCLSLFCADLATGNASWRRRRSAFLMPSKEGPEACSAHRPREDQAYQRDGVSFALDPKSSLASWSEQLHLLALFAS